MQAVLWDGYKQIKGELEMDDEFLHFRMIDFEDTDLQLDIPLAHISKVVPKRVFGIDRKALAIHSDQGKVNVFVVDEPEVTRQWIVDRMIFL